MPIEKVIVLEDDAIVRKNLEQCLRRRRYDVASVSTVAAAQEYLDKDNFDVIFLDVRLPDGDGTDLLKALHARPQRPLAVITTGFGSVESAVECMKNGAFDYLIKPFSNEQIEITLRNAEEFTQLVKVNAFLTQDSDDAHQVLLGQSAAMDNLRQLIRKVARTHATVIIQGESGTGKELVARALYRESPRANAPFIKLNCAAIPENLIESEFFGHEKRAFTGALNKREGRFELAHGGTILLDEISEVSPSVQAKLLRLNTRRNFADFIQQNRSPVSQLESALAFVQCASKCAFLMAEKFALDQVLGNRCTIQFDKWCVRARALTIKCARNQFLAGAAFALNQHRRVCPCDLSNELPQIIHRRALPEQNLVRVVAVLSQESVNLNQLRELFGFAERDLDLLIRERLDQIIKRPVLHAFDRRFHAAEARRNYCERPLRTRMQGFKQVRAVAIGKANVEENDVEIIFVEILLGSGDGRDAGHIIAAPAKALLEVFADDCVVLEHDHFLDGHESGPQMAPIKIGNAMGPLSDWGRQVLRRHQTVPEKRLLVLPIEQQNFHQQTLYCPK